MFFRLGDNMVNLTYVMNIAFQNYGETVDITMILDDGRSIEGTLDMDEWMDLRHELENW